MTELDIIRIVIVEDNKDIRYALEVMVQNTKDFFLAGSYSNGEDAVKNIPYLKVDVVMLDIELPGISGINVLTSLKKKMLKTHFMICTVFDQDEKVFEALKAGATSYILKGSSMDFLRSSIREIHSGGSPMSSDIARKIVNSFYKAEKSIEDEVNRLTAREEEILHHLAKGESYQQVADTLFISVKTIKKHINNIYEKLQVHSKVEAINKYFPR